jgi:DNA-binding transcriptional MocR family regulator
MLSVRRATDVHPQLLDQAVLADFIAGGHFESGTCDGCGTVYRERLEAPDRRHQALLLAAGFRLRPVTTGLHAVADLFGRRRVDRQRRGVRARRRSGADGALLHLAFAGRECARAGFAAVRPEGFRNGMERLAAAIDAARRGQQRGIVRRTTTVERIARPAGGRHSPSKIEGRTATW